MAARNERSFAYHIQTFENTSLMDGQWNFQGGRGLKGQNFRKERGCSCEIIFPEGHAKRVIIDSDGKCTGTYAYYVVLANKN